MRNNWMKKHPAILLGLALASGAGTAEALVIAPMFAGDYSAKSLGSIIGLPPSYGGLTLKAGDMNGLLIGGSANTDQGLIYEVGVRRDADRHIIGFSTAATPIDAVGAFNDGGVVYGPDGVLFISRWPVNAIGQTLPGSTAEDRIVDLTPLRVGGSHAALNFVPEGFAGEGRLKLVSWSAGQWYDAAYSPDGSGTFNIDSVIHVDLNAALAGLQNLPGGPEAFVYIEAGNAGFEADSLLVSDYSDGRISAYQLDNLGNPLVATRRAFITGLTGAEGATIDPLTGDFLFSTFGGGDQVVVVQGFLAPEGPVNTLPEPDALALISLGVLGIALGQRPRVNPCRARPRA